MDNFKEAYERLNAEQRSAVDYIDGPLLVIAGPGTGKTQLLSIRVANILDKTDVSPENILCLTFTEAGASNMRNRLMNFIGPEAYKVQIQTYHSFGSYILQEHRPDLSSSIDELERFNIIREIQSTLHPTDILRADRHTRQIISAIGDLKASALGPDDIRKIVNRNQIDTAKIYSVIEEDIQATKGLHWKQAEPVYNRILKSIESVALSKTAPKYIHNKIEPIATTIYRELAEALMTESNSEKPSTKLLGKWREKFFKKDKNDRYIFSDEVSNKKMLSLANIMELYAERLRISGLFDYNDMILSAIDILENDDEKRFNVQEKFQYILLDEFQDTNDAQAKLVSLLTNNPANEGKPNIMAVGDDDQAIYGFQGANTSNFFDFDEQYHPKHIFLTKNYRSSAPILDFAHNIIEQAPDRFCKAPNVNIDKQITAENPPANTKIELREFPVYQEEYSFVAEQVKELIENGTSASKIAIIAPKHKYLISILPYLHELNIPVSYEKRENILENENIIQLFTASNLLIAMNSSFKSADPYWFRILSMPCWQLETAQIISIIRNARENHRSIIEQMLACEDEKIKDIAVYFAELSAKTADYSADFIINNLCVKLFANSDNYELYSNLNTLRDLLRNKSSHADKKLLLTDFCNIINAYNTAELPILNKSPYHEADNSIQLQTVHSAKGLEYEHVFLIATDNRNWSDAKGNNDRITFPRNLEHIRHTGDSASEKIRVLFVAITRAKANLYLTYSLSDFAGNRSERLKFLNIEEVEDGIFASRIISPLFAKVIASTRQDINPSIISPDKWFDKYLPSDETRKNLLKPYVEKYRLSPTHLNTFIELHYGNGPSTFLERYIIGVPSEQSFALSYGTFIHEIMDEIAKEKISNEEAIKRFITKVDNSDGENDEKEDLKKRAITELNQFLSVRGDSLRNQKADSERSFFKDSIVLGNAILTGKIDRIEINEKDKTITISDFKTSAPKAKWNNADITFSYKIQLYFYKFLVEGSLEYRNYKVAKGRIDYISPNEDGDIVSLELNYKEAEANDIKHLIEVVFRHIKTLDFPSVEEAKTQNNPTKAFYDQLISEP